MRDFSVLAMNSSGLRFPRELCGLTAEKYVKIIRDVINDMEIKVRDRGEYHGLEKSVADIGRLAGKLREELAVIRLKRKVPGRCKYCPL